MKRSQCIEALYEELDEWLVVTIMGACAQELYDLGHRENFFYLEHAMGLASSIALGLALNLPNERILVLDGDGSVLMNLGSRQAALLRTQPVASQTWLPSPAVREFPMWRRRIASMSLWRLWQRLLTVTN